MPDQTPPTLLGQALEGNDLDYDGLVEWYADEERGFFETNNEYHVREGFTYDQFALNWLHGKPIEGKHFPVALAFGCAQGYDVACLPITVDRYIAIEPTTEFWSDNIGGKPAEFRKPNITGKIDLPDDHVDFVCAIACLHHVANVEYVVSELSRVLKPGGFIFIREPTISMGDFRLDRPGLTKRERGIPVNLMKKYISQSGLNLIANTYCSLNLLKTVFNKFRVYAPYNHKSFVMLDYLLGRLLGFNAKYYRPRLVDKFAPGSMAYVARKA